MAQTHLQAVQPLAEPTASIGVEGAELRKAIGHFATGVTVVTSLTPDGRPIGSTANALSSVSLDPPLVLVCLREESETLYALLGRERFAINVLGHGQLELAERFAGRSHGHTWDRVSHRRGVHGAPLLEGAVATLECTLHDIADGGDHRIVIGRVLEVRHPETHVVPLVFYRGAYASLGEPPEPDEASRRRAAAERGRRLTFSPLQSGLSPVFIPTRDGDISLVPVDQQSRAATSVIALVGEPRDSLGSLVYLHRGCMLGDALGHLGCRRAAALELALERIRAAGAGVVVYHRDDTSPFDGCCAGSAPSERQQASSPEETLRALRHAMAGLGLRETRLLSSPAEDNPLSAGALGLDVATIEPLELDG
jgi:flavin reductase (DIM6/NTAB) family NADH-FMN oxidoreductase RutF